MRSLRVPLVLWRYTAREVGTVFLAAFLAQGLINAGLVAYQLVQGEGLRLSLVWPVLLKLSTLSLYYTIPVSLLFAVTLGVGRMVADLEITALRASGISYLQFCVPVLLMGLIGTAVTDYLTSDFIPPVRYERRNLRKLFLRQISNLGYGGEKTITLPSDIGQIHCRRYYGNVLEDVLVSIWDAERLTGPGSGHTQKLPVRIQAERALIDTEIGQFGEDRIIITLEGAEITVPDDVLRGPKGDRLFLQRIGVDRYRLPIALTENKPGTKDKRSSRLRLELERYTAQLAEMERELSREKDLEARQRLQAGIGNVRKEIREIRTELARRRAFAFSCFTFLWISLPLTLWLNSRNRLVPFFVGNMVAVGVFFPLVTLGLVLAKRGFPPGWVLQAGNLVLFIGGLIFLWRLQRA